MKFIKIALLVLIVYVLYHNLFITKREDIYVNRLVYSKITHKLFTGEICFENEKNQGCDSFCEGIPCGTWWREGEIIESGIYLSDSILSNKTKSMIQKDTLNISLQRDGAKAQYYDSFYVTILKSNNFFMEYENKYKSYTDKLANSIFKDTKHLKYEYLHLYFTKDISLKTFTFIKVKYKVTNDTLSQPLIQRYDTSIE